MAEYGRTNASRASFDSSTIFCSARPRLSWDCSFTRWWSTMGHFSGFAGNGAGRAHAAVVVRTAEGCSIFPQSLREASAALGMPRVIMIAHIAPRATGVDRCATRRCAHQRRNGAASVQAQQHSGLPTSTRRWQVCRPSSSSLRFYRIGKNCRTGAQHHACRARAQHHRASPPNEKAS